MREENNSKKNKTFEILMRYRLIFEILAGALFLYLVFLKNGMIFETNDDQIISHLLSGSIISKQQIRIFDHVHVFESTPLVLMYHLFPTVPWYGLYILFCHVLIIFLPIDAILSRAEKYSHIVIAAFSIGVVSLAQWYIHSRLQYSSTAELLAITGFICFVFYKNRKQAIIILLILETMSFAMRYNAMLFILPFGASLLLLMILSKKKEERKESIKEILCVIAMLLGIIFIGLVSAKLVYLPSPYKNTVSIHNDRIEIIDYNYVPEYEDVKDILDKYDISEAKYRAFFNYVILDWNLDSPVLEELAEYVKSNPKRNSISVRDILSDVYNASFHNNFCKLSGLIISSWLAALLIIVLYRKYSYYLFVLSYGLARGMCWGYLFSKGRVVDRVLLPLLITDSIVSISIIVLCIMSEENDEKKALTRVRWIITVAILLVITMFSFRTTREQYRYIVSMREGIECLNEYQSFINDYCDNHPDKSYILSSEIYIYWPVDIADTSAQSHNYSFSGGWYSLLPESQEYIREYIESSEELYYICLLPDEYPTNEYNLNYFSELTGEAPVLEEELVLPTGGKAGVYRINANVIKSGTASITCNAYRMLATGPKRTVQK